MTTVLKSVSSAFFAVFAAIGAFAANVAKIGDTEYATIDAAVAAWTEGDIIELLTDIERDSYFVFSKNTYALDGKGHTIKCTKAHSTSWRYFVNANGGTQTFKNITIDANGKVPYVMQAIDGGKLILENVTIKGATTTSVGSWYNKSTALGYGIHVNNGSVVATDITISDCEIADVYLDGSSSSFVLNGDNCNVGVIGTASTDEAVSSTAKGYYAYEVAYKTTLTSGTSKTISNKSWNGIIDQVQKSITSVLAGSTINYTIQSATIKLLQDVTLDETFTSNDTDLSIDGDGKTITATIKVTSTPSSMSNVVLGNGSTLDFSESQTCGFSNVTVDANDSINIILPSAYDIDSYSLPVTLGTDATATISVGDVKYIAKNGVIAPAETVAQIGDVRYSTLQAAIDAAANGATIHVLKDVALTSSLTVAVGKTLTLNLAGKAVTISSANYALVNNGSLTIIDSPLVSLVQEAAAISDDSVAIVIAGVSANSGIATLDDSTGGSIAGVQNNGTFELESGTVVATSSDVPAIDNTENAVATISGGTVNGTLNSSSTSAITVAGGTFTNSNVSEYLDESQGVDASGNVITYLAQLGDTKYQTLSEAFGAAAEFDTVTVLDSATDVSAIASYVAEGLFPISNGDNTYTLRAMPTASVAKLPAFTLTANRDKHNVWNGGVNLTADSTDRPLDSVMNFLANDDGKAEANESGFADWKCDFYLTFTGMNGDSFVADDACYLAGNYGAYGWIIVPLTGETIENNKLYPVVAAFDPNITYRQICEDVNKFTAAIHIADAIMSENPELKVNLALKMTNNKDSSQELVVGSYDYTVSDLMGEYNPEVAVADGVEVDDNLKTSVGNALANAYAAAEGKLAVTILKQGETFSMIDVSSTDGYEIPAEGLELTFPAESLADGASAIIVHKHDGKSYVSSATVEYGFVTYKNTLGFSEFTVGDAAALANAFASGGEIVLTSDITLDAMVTIPEGVTATLDLNGYTITGAATSSDRHIYALNNFGDLTIKGTGTIAARGIYNAYPGYNGNNVATGAKMTIEEGVTIKAVDVNGGFAVGNYATFVMNGGSIEAYEDDPSDAAGAGYDATALVNYGVATLNGGKIKSTTNFTYAIENQGTLNVPADSTIVVTGAHGALQNYVNTATINGGTFVCSGVEGQTDNVVYVQGGILIINGGTFTGDSDSALGGTCVHDATVGGATINGGTFSGSSGGDVLGTTGTTIKGGTFANLTETKWIAAGYELGEDGTVAEVEETYLTLTEFVTAVINANGVYDGNGITVQITPASGDARSETTEGLPNRLQKYGNPEVYYAQYQRFSGLADVSISNVNFVFVPAAVTVIDSWNTSGYTTTADNINGELQFMNSGAVALTSCTFDQMSVSPINAASVTVSGCAFKDLDAYAIKDINASTVSVTGSTFTNCNGGFWMNAAPATLTVTGNTFTEVGRRGAIQFSANGDYTSTTMNITDNAVTGGAFLWQLNSTVTYEQVSAILDTTKNTYTTAYVDGSTIPTVTAGLSGSGTAADPYLISNLAELKWFRDHVNAGNKYANQYVKLIADIDLSGENWTPIGTASNVFAGVFDGDNHTISNLTIDDDTSTADDAAYLGLFGVVKTESLNAGLKNLIIRNVKIDTQGYYVGALGAHVYGCNVENVLVTGDIYIMSTGYVGGVMGDFCYGNATNVDVKDTTMDGGYISGIGGIAGGVFGWCTEGNHVYSGCDVENITIECDRLFGGISGLIHYGNTAKDCTLNNVTLKVVDSGYTGTKTGYGTVFGNLCGDNKAGSEAGSTVTNVTVTNVAVVDEDGNAIENVLEVGPVYNTTGTPVPVKVNDTYYSTLQTAINAAEEGETVTLLTDVTLIEDEDIYIRDGKDVTIQGSGKTIAATGNTVAFRVTGGKLTLGKGLNVTADTYMCIFITGGEVITYANLTKNGTMYSAVQGNGTKVGKMTVAGGTITCSDAIDAAAIYWPQNDKLTITGGTISGATGVRLSSGSLEITGGTIIATGSKQDYTAATGNYSPDTSDAVMIENIGGDTGYEAIASVSITGGNFISKNASAVASYAAVSLNSEATAVTGFITGGTFNTAVDSSYCASGYEPIANTDGTYSVVVVDAVAMVGWDSYKTFGEAVTAAIAAGETMELVSNAPIKEEVVINANLFVEMNDMTLTKADGGSIKVENATVNLARGTLADFTASDIVLSGNATITLPAKIEGDFSTYYTSVNEDETFSIATAFRSYIQVVDGVPYVGFLKDHSTEHIYVLKGKADLADADWTEVDLEKSANAVADPLIPLYWTNVNSEGLKFFRIDCSTK